MVISGYTWWILICGKRSFDVKYICQFSSSRLHPLMLHPIWINIGLIINMFKHFFMYISWREDLCLFYDDKIFRAQGTLLGCHHSVSWALFTLPEGASLVSSQQSWGWKGFSYLYRRSVYVDLKLSEICGGAEGRRLPVCLLQSAHHQQHRSEHRWRQMWICLGETCNRFSFKGGSEQKFRLLENIHKSEQGKRETIPGTGKALKSPWCLLHNWGLTLPLEGSRLDFPLLFLYWQKQVLKQIPCSGKGLVGAENFPT